jgi:hypothetical protein
MESNPSAYPNFSQLQGLIRDICAEKQSLIDSLRRPYPGKFRPVELHFFRACKLIDVVGRIDHPKGQTVRFGDVIDIVGRDNGPAPGMFCTTISGFPGMCLPRYCATKRPQSSIAPPAEFPTTSLIVFPLKNSCAFSCAALATHANPTRKDTERTIVFISPPSSIRA